MYIATLFIVAKIWKHLSVYQWMNGWIPHTYSGMLFSHRKEGFPGDADNKESACNSGDPGLISLLWRSPGEGNGNLLQYSCLENPMDRGAWWATVPRVAKSWTRLKWLSTHACFSYGGFPGGASCKEPTRQCQCRRCKRHRFNPWVGKIPSRRERLCML